MRTIITVIIIVISFFSNAQNNESITNLDLLVIDSHVVFSHFEDIQVFQFSGTDSLNMQITHSRKIDSHGNAISVYYKNHKTEEGHGRVGFLGHTEYNKRNQIIVSTAFFESFERGTIHKTFSYYDDSLLIREERFELKTRLRPEVDKGFGRPGGCIVTPEDYEKEPTWKLIEITHHKYDSLGRKTLKYSPIFSGSQNRYEYKYDKDNNLIEEKSMNELETLYTEKFEYSENQITSELQWNNSGYSGSKTIKTLDGNGNLLNQTVFQNGNEFSTTYNYNNNGDLTRIMVYDSDGELYVTHVYKYN